jgi:hypothetical protein
MVATREGRGIRAAAWLRRNRLVLLTGVAAALPVIVATIHAVATGWVPLGDDAIIVVRSYDVLSTHPPLLGPYSTSSRLIGHPVLSPGPLLFWLLALPARLGELGPPIAMGLVNTAIVMGIVALARRRGGTAFMIATGAALAAMCGSLVTPVWYGVWGPSSAILPFTLLLFLAWSLACGEWRLLPLTALVASFAVQAHLTYVLPGAAALLVAGAFLLAGRPRVPRRWLLATAAVLLVCWSFPLAEEAVHRPGNFERIAQAATADGKRYGASAGWHGVVRTVGVPPWWLRAPRPPFGRVSDVIESPDAASTASAVLVLALLAVAAAAALRTGRRELAAAALIALALMAALLLVTASTPSSVNLFGVIGYTLWWAAPAGMFAWLVLGYAAVVFAGERRPAWRLPSRRVVPATAAGVSCVVVVGALVAAAERPDRLQRAYDPARAIVDAVRAQVPAGHTVFVTGSRSEMGENLQGGVAYGLRRSGVPFVVTSLPGIGTRYDPARHAHDSVLTVDERRPGAAVAPRPLVPPARVIARVTLAGVPDDVLPEQRGVRPVVVTLGPPPP